VKKLDNKLIIQHFHHIHIRTLTYVMYYSYSSKFFLVGRGPAFAGCRLLWVIDLNVLPRLAFFWQVCRL